MSIVDYIDKSSLFIFLIVIIYYIIYSVYDFFVKLEFERKILTKDAQRFKVNLFYFLGQTLFFSIIIIPPFIFYLKQWDYFNGYTFYISSIMVLIFFIFSLMILFLEWLLSLKTEFYVYRDNSRLTIIKKLDDNSLLCRNEKRNLVIVENLYGLEIKQDFVKGTKLYNFYRDRVYVLISLIILVILFAISFNLVFKTEIELYKVIGLLAIFVEFIITINILLNYLLYIKFKKKFNRKE